MLELLNINYSSMYFIFQGSEAMLNLRPSEELKGSLEFMVKDHKVFLGQHIEVHFTIIPIDTHSKYAALLQLL